MFAVLGKLVSVHDDVLQGVLQSEKHIAWVEVEYRTWSGKGYSIFEIHFAYYHQHGERGLNFFT